MYICIYIRYIYSALIWFSRTLFDSSDIRRSLAQVFALNSFFSGRREASAPGHTRQPAPVWSGAGLVVV